MSNAQIPEPVDGQASSSSGLGGAGRPTTVTTGGGGGKCAGSASNTGLVPLNRGDRVWVELPDGYGMHNALYHNYASFYGYLLYTAATVEQAAAAAATIEGDGTLGLRAASNDLL